VTRDAVGWLVTDGLGPLGPRPARRQATAPLCWKLGQNVLSIEVFVLEEGTYALLEKSGPGEVARSEVLAGFEVVVDEVVCGAG
jgi:hypothetical protein